MKLKNTVRIGITIAISFMCFHLRGKPDGTEIKQQLERIIQEVPNGTFSLEEAAKVLEGIIQKTPAWATTPSFNEALLACYRMDLSGNKLECYEELSGGELQEPLFCAIQDGFDNFNRLTNKGLNLALLSDISIPELYDRLNDAFHSDYEYWSYAIIAWILKRRANAGDASAQEALENSIATLEKTLQRLDPDFIVQIMKALIPLLEEDSPFVKSLIFQKALRIAFPQLFQS